MNYGLLLNDIVMVDFSFMLEWRIFCEGRNPLWVRSRFSNLHLNRCLDRGQWISKGLIVLGFARFWSPHKIGFVKLT